MAREQNVAAEGSAPTRWVKVMKKFWHAVFGCVYRTSKCSETPSACEATGSFIMEHTPSASVTPAEKHDESCGYYLYGPPAECYCAPIVLQSAPSDPLATKEERGMRFVLSYVAQHLKAAADKAEDAPGSAEMHRLQAYAASSLHAAPIQVRTTDDRIIFACHADGRWYDEEGQEWKESGDKWYPVTSAFRFGRIPHVPKDQAFTPQPSPLAASLRGLRDELTEIRRLVVFVRDCAIEGGMDGDLLSVARQAQSRLDALLASVPAPNWPLVHYDVGSMGLCAATSQHLTPLRSKVTCGRCLRMLDARDAEAVPAPQQEEDDTLAGHILAFAQGVRDGGMPAIASALEEIVEPQAERT
jgi:hypothetical protein